MANRPWRDSCTPALPGARATPTSQVLAGIPVPARSRRSPSLAQWFEDAEAAARRGGGSEGHGGSVVPSSARGVARDSAGARPRSPAGRGGSHGLSAAVAAGVIPGSAERDGARAAAAPHQPRAPPRRPHRGLRLPSSARRHRAPAAARPRQARRGLRGQLPPPPRKSPALPDPCRWLAAPTLTVPVPRSRAPARLGSVQCCQGLHPRCPRPRQHRAPALPCPLELLLPKRAQHRALTPHIHTPLQRRWSRSRVSCCCRWSGRGATGQLSISCSRAAQQSSQQTPLPRHSPREGW